MKILKTPEAQRKANKKYYQEHKDQAKIYRDKYKLFNKEKLKEQDRISRLVRNYGISIEEYNGLLEEQDHKCAICGKGETIKLKNGNTRLLSIDHNHNTGQVRGLLCHKCNTTLGFLSENLQLFDKAKEYLTKYKNN